MLEVHCNNCHNTFWIDDSREATKKYGCPYCQCQTKRLLFELI